MIGDFEEAITNIEKGLIVGRVGDGDLLPGAPMYKVYVKKLTPLMTTNPKEETLSQNTDNILGYNHAKAIIKDSIKRRNYYEADNVTDYPISLTTGKDGNLTLSKGEMEAMGKLAINQFIAQTTVATGAGVGANGGGPIATVDTIPPTPLASTASSEKTSLEGKLEITEGQGKLTDLYNVKLSKEHPCVVMLVGGIDEIKVIHIKDVVVNER